MTNQNCLACHQPMYVNKTYFICQTDGCELENHLIYKSDIEKRPPHPLEQKVNEYESALQRVASKNVLLMHRIEAFKMRLIHEISLLKMNTPAPGAIEKPENYYVKAYEQILKGVTELFGDKDE